MSVKGLDFEGSAVGLREQSHAAVGHGAVHVHQQQFDQAPPAKLALPDSLTSRELEILALIAGGLTNSEIAARLFISPLTCKSHVSRILTKLDARDRTQLVVIAYESGLVIPGQPH